MNEDTSDRGSSGRADEDGEDETARTGGRSHHEEDAPDAGWDDDSDAIRNDGSDADRNDDPEATRDEEAPPGPQPSSAPIVPGEITLENALFVLVGVLAMAFVIGRIVSLGV